MEIIVAISLECCNKFGFELLPPLRVFNLPIFFEEPLRVFAKGHCTLLKYE
jgi:hypothetical protein